MPEFEHVEDEEEDYNLEDFFLNPTLYPLQTMIDYRIKLLLKNDTPQWRRRMVRLTKFLIDLVYLDSPVFLLTK